MQTNPKPPLAFLCYWWPVLAGLAVLYIPTYYDLSQTIWTKEEFIHGPMVLVACLWLFWHQRQTLLTHPQQTRPFAGSIILGFGLLLYVIGRSQEILLFEVGSQIPVLLGALLIALGGKTLRTLGFPLFFLLFMIPLPGFIVEAMTGPLKQQVSVLSENVLYALDYPVARSGVVLTIGPYQLLVADACSGLNAMFSLSALGLIYLYLLHHPSRIKNTLLIASILPIAFLANVIRVITLALITYHFGEEAGQGFLHKFAGILLFSAALILLFVLDAFLDKVLTQKRPG